MSEADDAQARKARADAIRRARDARNEKIDSGDATASGGGESDEANEADAHANAEAEADADADADARESPNYVDLIDQKMRRDQPGDE